MFSDILKVFGSSSNNKPSLRSRPESLLLIILLCSRYSLLSLLLSCPNFLFSLSPIHFLFPDFVLALCLSISSYFILLLSSFFHLPFLSFFLSFLFSVCFLYLFIYGAPFFIFRLSTVLSIYTAAFPPKYLTLYFHSYLYRKQIDVSAQMSVTPNGTGESSEKRAWKLEGPEFKTR